MRATSHIGVLTASLTLLSCGEVTQSKPTPKPNVLMILTDDQGWGDFGFNGNENIHTPVLDSLESVSAHLTNFYVTPLSASTRAGLLTGCYNLRSGVLGVTRGAETMSSSQTTLAEALGEAGYRTGCFGKWHNGAYYPQDALGQGFDEFVGFNGGHIANYFSTELLHQREAKKSEGYISDYLTDRAIEFMSKESENPFFCYVPYNAPHAPIQVPEEFYEPYKHLQTTPSDITAGVYAMCANIDYNVGRMLKFLEQSGSLSNTIVVFTTDNGPKNPRYNGSMRGVKGHLYEGGVKTPCLVYWRGRTIKTDIDLTLSHIDIMPTILSACGVESPQGIDGIDFSSLLTGQENLALVDSLESRYLFTHKSPSQTTLSMNESAVFNSRYKLVHRHSDNFELYDLKADPNESEDIAMREPQVLADMKQELSTWFESVELDYRANEVRSPSVGLLSEGVVLPAHEASFEAESLRYNANKWGWAGDWFVDICADDRVFWSVDIATEACYQISLQYALPEGMDARVTVMGGEFVELEPFVTQSIPSPDITPRGVAYEQSWGFQTIAEKHLSKGLHNIELNFEGCDISQLELKGIQIKLKI